MTAAITGISPGVSAYEIRPGRRGGASAESAVGNFGPDTVTISDAARQILMGANAATDGLVEGGKTVPDEVVEGIDAEADASENTSRSGATLNRKSFFSILMESLFLAELEESGAGRSARRSGAGQPGADQPEAGSGGSSETDAPRTDASGMTVSSSATKQSAQSVNPLLDGPKAAQLKKLITDFMSGKADLSDLPKAMAVGASGGNGSGTGIARKSADAAGQTGDDATGIASA